jgi:hypothetical protein
MIGDSTPVAYDNADNFKEEVEWFTPPLPEDIWNDLSNANNVVDSFDLDLNKSDADESTPEACDEYLKTDVLLPHDGEFLKVIVKGSKQDSSGAPMN